MADYENLEQAVKLQIESEADLIANLSNISAFIMFYLEDLNWAGFYILKGDELVLGPFQGKPACCRIPLGKGVCGTAARQKTTIRVEDVHKFEGHIACDSASNSEIVVPLCKNGQVWGVLDIDSPNLNRFSEIDQINLEKIAKIIETAINFS